MGLEQFVNGKWRAFFPLNKFVEGMLVVSNDTKFGFLK